MDVFFELLLLQGGKLPHSMLNMKTEMIKTLDPFTG